MPVKQLQPECQKCGNTSNLFYCGRCSAVQYCSAAHQTQDSKQHLPACSRIWDRLSPIQQCEELPLDDILSVDSPITSSIPADNTYPVFNTHGTVRQVDQSLRMSLIGICIKQNTHASLKLAIEQIRMLARYRIAPPLFFVPILLRMGADGICYNLLSIERRITACEKEGGETVALQRLYREAQSIMEGEEFGCDVFEDLRHWVFWSPMPSPRSMAALVFVLQVWIDDLENAVQFDRTIATSLRRKLNYDTVEIIRGYLFETEVMIGNRKVLQDRAEKVLQELKRHQDYVLKASCYSNREFWEQLILGAKARIINGNIGTPREAGATVGFPSFSGHNSEDLAVFRRILLDDESAFRYLTDFFERQPLYLKGPSSGRGLDWVRVWQEVSRLTTARSDALQDGSS
ncbi:hypothetical protein TWF506_006780 [Arthrobotrys conoides]|uniref:MYND-type domain-containing protein n=1 Tax=Arthrobotrys conoides TaxID=74498 RepID=A0AAN8NHF4_9PEZI